MGNGRGSDKKRAKVVEDRSQTEVRSIILCNSGGSAVGAEESVAAPLPAA